jgi:hypothetical protein
MGILSKQSLNQALSNASQEIVPYILITAEYAFILHRILSVIMTVVLVRD